MANSAQHDSGYFAHRPVKRAASNSLLQVPGPTRHPGGAPPKSKIPRVALFIETSRTYGRGVLRGIARYAHAQGPWSFFIQERELHGGIPDWLRHWRGDGVIARIEDQRTARALLRLGCPDVDVLGNRRFAGIPGFDTDADAVARLAADFFGRAGFGHFAFCGYPGIPFSDRREDAFARRLAGQGRQLRVLPPLEDPAGPDHIQAVERRGLGVEGAVADWLREQPRPLAVLACNDTRGQQVLNACREHGLRVPEDVAVMGVDNDNVLCPLCDPPLSSIEPDTERLGAEAAALLARLMAGASAPTGITQIPPLRIAERASTDVVALDDPIMVQAVRFIRDHVGQGIAVKDVLAHVGRSRSDLEQRFRRWLGCSVRAEIVRRRLDHVAHLLTETDLSVNDVAARAGFATVQHFCRVFRRQFGRTPSEHRAACEVG